jgi:hypothetical protein
MLALWNVEEYGQAFFGFKGVREFVMKLRPLQDTTFNNCCITTVTTVTLLTNCLNVDRSTDFVKQAVLSFSVTTHKIDGWIGPGLRLAQP